MKFVVEEYDGSLDAMFRTNLATLREQLLAIHGIGPETADAILLYAGGLPTFVVDTYTHRILARHGWIGYDADYHEIKDHFESTLPADAPLYNEYHALLGARRQGLLQAHGTEVRSVPAGSIAATERHRRSRCERCESIRRQTSADPVRTQCRHRGP